MHFVEVKDILDIVQHILVGVSPLNFEIEILWTIDLIVRMEKVVFDRETQPPRGRFHR